MPYYIRSTYVPNALVTHMCVSDFCPLTFTRPVRSRHCLCVLVRVTPCLHMLYCALYVSSTPWGSSWHLHLHDAFCPHVILNTGRSLIKRDGQQLPTRHLPERPRARRNHRCTTPSIPSNALRAPHSSLHSGINSTCQQQSMFASMQIGWWFIDGRPFISYFIVPSSFTLSPLSLLSLLLSLPPSPLPSLLSLFNEYSFP